MTEKKQNSVRSAKRGHGPGRRFKKGQSGNPLGRTPVPAEYKAALEVMEPRALAALDAMIADPRHPRHGHAVEYAINRRHGTPTTRSEITGEGGGPVKLEHLTTAERLAKLQRLQDEAESDGDSDDGADA